MRSISAETGRNKEAVLYLMERAWCPLSVRGATVTAARCGAYDDDMEVRRGWTVDPDGTDTAPSTGPVRPEQPGLHDVGWREAARARRRRARSRSLPGRSQESSANAYDLDGRTSIRSARIKLPTRPARG